MFFSFCNNINVLRPIHGHLKKLSKMSNLGRYRHLSFIPLNRLAFLNAENDKRNSLLLSTPYTQNNAGCANKFRRSFSVQNSQSESKSDNGRKGSSKTKLLIMGFGFGAVIGVAYFYSKNFRNKIVPMANIDSENKLLFPEPPPVEFIAKKVYLI